MKSKIVRTRYTWLAYAMLGFFAYMQASLGPIMPFLRDELGLNYSIAGLHVSMLALGMSIAGMTTDRISARIGRYRTFWLGGAGMCLGGLLLIVARLPLLTLTASLIMGLLGGFTLIMI